ncbi:MAG: YybH family protein [Vicinamibacterales bacterium]
MAFALAAACAPPAPPDTSAQDEAAIRALETAWSSALAAKDVDKFVAYYAPDAVVLPPNGPMESTPAGIRKALGDFMALPGLAMTFRPSAVGVAKGGDVAYTYGTYDLSMTGPDGKPMQDKGKYVTVYKKQADGSWKAAVDTFNSDLPAAPPPPPPGKKK